MWAYEIELQRRRGSERGYLLLKREKRARAR